MSSVSKRDSTSHFRKNEFVNITVYCCHSANVITFSLAQSDHIKRLLLHIKKNTKYAFNACKTYTKNTKYAFNECLNGVLQPVLREMSIIENFK